VIYHKEDCEEEDGRDKECSGACGEEGREARGVRLLRGVEGAGVDLGVDEGEIVEEEVA
jgi:hypothetical protein